MYLVLGGVPGPGGVYLALGGRGVGCTWPGGLGVYLVLGGVPGLRGVLDTHTPPVNRITHTCKNITLAQLRCGR